MEAVGEEVRDRDGVDLHAVAAQPLGDDEPVEIGADRETDGRPAGAGEAGPVGEAGQAHEQPAGHVRGLGAEGRDPRAQRAPAQEVGLGVAVGPLGEIQADADDQAHIDDHGDKML